MGKEAVHPDSIAPLTEGLTEMIGQWTEKRAWLPTSDRLPFPRMLVGFQPQFPRKTFILYPPLSGWLAAGHPWDP